MKNVKPSLKMTRIEQILDFCDRLMYLLTRNRVFMTRSSIKKAALKLLDLISRINIVMLIKSVFYVNNFALSLEYLDAIIHIKATSLTL